MQISEWVMHSACAQLRSWQDTGWEYPRMAVNISTRQFAQTDLPRRVAQVIREYGLTPDQLCLETTESMVMSDPFSVAETIAELSSMGVRIALDEFGTGYSSLSYLKRFRVDSLRVDRSFVSGIPANADDKSVARGGGVGQSPVDGNCCRRR